MRASLGRLNRAWSLLGTFATLAGALAVLAACVAPPGAPGNGLQSGSSPAAQAAAGRRVAILLPLSGPNAELGRSMQRAAQLALDGAGTPPLDTQDTGGTAEGAVTAAKAALDAGAGIILGPLTTAETAAVAPLARAAGVSVLAFTSDVTQAQPGIWTLGITPAQQVRRLVLAVQAENKTRLAAIVPTNILGDALATGLTQAAAEARLPEPRIVRPSAGFGSVNDALKGMSGFDGRRGAIEAAQRTARARNDADGRREAEEIGRRPVPPPPLDALFLGLSGEALFQAVPLLAFYDIGPSQIRILGPALWARDASRLGAISGAWYAAPDPALRAPFEQRFTARFGAPPRDYASLAFDAAGVVRAIAGPSGFSPALLTRPEGFAGADGVFALQPDGRVRRGLAIFEIDRGGAHIVQPAPQTMAAPGA